MGGVCAFQNGSTVTGFAAREQAAENPLNTFSSVKRLIGRRYAEVSSEAAQLPYGITDSSCASGSAGHGGASAASGACGGVLAALGHAAEGVASGSGAGTALRLMSAVQNVISCRFGQLTVYRLPTGAIPCALLMI